MLVEQHPRATINFPLFHDLARGRRLMSTNTVFALANRSVRLASLLSSVQSKSLGARKSEIESTNINRSKAILKFCK